MLVLPPSPPRRRVGLTPMIDVVFLLLIFFMLAARFGLPQALPVSMAGQAEVAYEGPPRLVTVGTDGLRVNGRAVPDAAAALKPLMSGPDDIVVLMPAPGATAQDMADALLELRAAGLTRLAIAEGTQP